jgi:FkbM family methyltransferase
MTKPSRTFQLRKLQAGWALGGLRFLGLAVHSVLARLWALLPAGPEEARDFVVSVVTAGGDVERSGDSSAHVRVQQPLDELGALFTAFVRPGTSDLAVWNQVVRERQYAAVVRVLEEAVSSEVETILDLGANIGLTSAYLGAIYPKARILAVEPDAANFQLLKQNTATLGARVQALQAAFWPRDEALSWTSRPFRDGRDWARAVETGGNGQDSIQAITPSGALALLGAERADLAKVDIEGAEAVFFATETDTDALLRLADVFAIELHAESIDPFKAAIAFDRHGFLGFPAGDFLIAIRRERLRIPS